MSDRWVSASDLREQIMLRVDAGDGLACIERELIEPAALADEDKAALWLLAWCTSTPPHRRPFPSVAVGARPTWLDVGRTNTPVVEVIDQGSGFQPANAGSNMEPTGGMGTGSSRQRPVDGE